MTDINEGIRELSSYEIAAVSGGGSSSSVYCYLSTVERVLDSNGGDRCAAPPLVKALDSFLDYLRK